MNKAVRTCSYKNIFNMILMSALVLVSINISFASVKSGKGKKEKISDQLTMKETIAPKELANEMKLSGKKKPLILHVGFDFLYNQDHIAGAKFMGPASRDQGLANLKSYVKKLPHDSPIVIYCGCCPWDHCPNIRPAYKTLVDLGFTNVKALYLPENFPQDWKAKGYPVSK